MIRFVDLTHPIEENMPTFNAPWHVKVKIKQLGSIDSVGRETKELILGTHTGTHIDAPLHFVKEGMTIDTLPFEKLTGVVKILDFSFLGDNEAITPEVLQKIQIEKRMIFRFNWAKYWKTDRFYKDYPYFTKEAALYLINNGVELLGMDTPSPDDSRIVLGSERDSEIHKLFLSNGVILVEYLANLEKMDDLNGWNLIAMPLKIKGADGSPARVCIYKDEGEA